MVKRRMSVARKINFLFRTVCFTQLLCVVKLLYHNKKGKGQPYLKPQKWVYRGPFCGYRNKNCHISETTRCIAMNFSGYVAKTFESLTKQYHFSWALIAEVLEYSRKCPTNELRSVVLNWRLLTVRGGWVFKTVFEFHRDLIVVPAVRGWTVKETD